jgi:hypothetical protein
LNGELQDLADFTKLHSEATAVYIGKLVTPKKPITDQDDDKAHEDPEAAKCVHFLNATEGHNFLED